MARPKSYDRKVAIEKACFAFWEHGYQALGVRELERLTGLNQFAIRSEFGGKEGLYCEALSLYSDAAVSGAMAPMATGGIPEIIDFLYGLVTPGSPTSSEFGCLIVNTGIENARVKSARLADAAEVYWTALATHFAQALDKNGASSQDLPRALVSGVMGVHAQNRLLRDQTAGRPLVELLCRHLESLQSEHG